MGSTIRRQPLSFKIPASPDYQFLNVLNFKGLNMTDNPFNADVTTASDCLNVYVDEANALTTRPRLELFYDLHKQHPGMTKLLGVYPLSIGYLFHYIENGSYALDIAYEVSNTLTFVNVDTLTHGVNPKVDKLSVFEQNDKIYILSGEGYYFITYTIMDDVIVRAEIDNVEGYVPTTRIGFNKRTYNSNTKTYETDTDGVEYESLNLLSDKYKETYFWDGISNPITDIKNIIGVENNYYIPSPLDDNLKGYNILHYYEDNTFFALSSNKLLYCIISDNFNKITETVLSTNIKTLYNFACASNVKRCFIYYQGYVNDYQDSIFHINSDGSFIENGFINDSDRKILKIGMSPNGNYVWDLNYYASGVISNTSLNVTIYNDLLERQVVSFAISGIDYSFEGKHITFTNDEKTVYISGYIDTGSTKTYKYYSGTINYDSGNQHLQIDCVLFYDGKTSKYYDVSDAPEMKITKNDLLYWVEENVYYDTLLNSGNYVYLCDNFSKDDINTIIDDKINNTLRLDNNYGWFVHNNKLYIISDISDVSKYYDSLINFDGLSDVSLYTPGVLLLIKKSTTNDTLLTFNSSTEPQLILTINVDGSDVQYTERKNKFFKSLLTTRFNNERWFASGNRLYYTSYNDPTYIGLYNYNDLGESDENITGFNLADDSTLIVYKDNRVHSVRYGEVGENVYTYIYSDSPNIVGNNAFGGSIVSILTEMPLQISYDGIYALRQLTNVQSSGRISELISEGINKKWLKESKEIVKNCKTINRLYWTYFILSEKDYSKIYLLDNRTQSWYYWELPISILNAFVKNNTTYFSDIYGNLYTLKTTDLFNKFNPEITEYYDEGKKLIKWNWKSQILPMKTINYSKKLVSTTFIMSDTDEKDEYGLNYKFKAFRKTASQTQETTLTNNINYIVSTTKRTLVPRFNFMQIELSNIEGTSDDFDHNKLRLIGLAFKYVLLEGLV